MADWPIFGGQNSATWAAVVTPGGSFNVKGNWTQIASAWPYTSWVAGSVTPTRDQYLLDIGINGGATTIVGNFHIDSNVYSPSYDNKAFFFPVTIQKGQSVYARAQCSYGAQNVDFMLYPFMPHFVNQGYGTARCTVLGANTADSGGISIDSGAVSWTKGAWVQFSANIAHDVKYIVLNAGNGNNYSREWNAWNTDVGITASPGNCIVVADFRFSESAAGDMVWPQFSHPLAVNIPAGSEIHARCAGQITTAANRVFDLILLCFG